jgi:uncharacterized membrane-anchored protein YhcB (DUF1043 family)
MPTTNPSGNRVTASATTYPTSNHQSSEQSHENKYGGFESTLKKEESGFKFDPDFKKTNINEHFNQVADDLDSKIKSYEELAAHFLENAETELLSSKNSTQRFGK